MGCCCGTPIPPPDQKMVGQWILNSQSKDFRYGYAQYRYAKKVGIAITSFTDRSNQSLCRLTINEDGMISYCEYNGSALLAIDGPAYSWQDG